MFDDDYIDDVVGMDMIDDGMMQYEEGVILTQMGMPGLGMAEMQMGEMEMVQGEIMFDAGMMQNGYGMGYGAGYGTVGLIAAEQALLIAETGYVCMGLGCTYPCCVRRCQPGCILPCCRKQVVMVSNSNQQSPRPMINNQQGYPYQQQINQQVYTQNQGINQINQQQIKPIFTGSIYHQQFLSWRFNQNAMVTLQHFTNEPLSSIIKLKVKKQVLHNDCFFLKTSHFNSDNYYAVPKHEQANWFCTIVWAKLQLQRFGCDLYGQFNGFIEGRILRKSRYLGEWAFRQIVIDNQGLKSYVNRNQQPTTRIHRIPQLWTRFELVQQQKYLVIKLHFEGTKYEYAVPLNDAVHWIRAFFFLMR